MSTAELIAANFRFIEKSGKMLAEFEAEKPILTAQRGQLITSLFPAGKSVLPKQEAVVHGATPEVDTVVMPSRGAEGNGTVSLAEGKAQALPVKVQGSAIAHAGSCSNDEHGPSAGPFYFTPCSWGSSGRASGSDKDKGGVELQAKGAGPNL